MLVDFCSFRYQTLSLFRMQPVDALLTGDGHVGRARRRGDGVEDHAADAVDAHGGRARLRRGAVGVGGARDDDPVRDAVGAHHAAHGRRAARDAERHRRGRD